MYFYIEVVQFLQEAALGENAKLCQIVGHIVLHSIFSRRYQSRRKVRFIIQLAKAVFQRFHDIRRIFLSHRPDGNRAGMLRFVGIGNIKVVLQPCPAVVVTVKDSNASSPTVHPPPKPSVPALDFQYGGGVRALGID